MIIRRVFRLVAPMASVALLLMASIEGRAGPNAPACQLVRVWETATSVSGCDFRDESSDPVTRARNFIEAYRGQLKMPAAATDLVHLGTLPGLASRHLRFQQFLFGYPVYNGQITVHENLNGRVTRMHSSDIRSVANAVAGKMNFSRDAAEAIARQAIHEPGADSPAGVAVRLARQVWYPLADGRLVLAWEILITAERPLLDYRVIVDRTSGEILLREDRLLGWVIGSGKVFRPNPIQASGDLYLTEGSDAGYINSLTGTGNLLGLAEGTGKLKGRFVDVSFPSINLPQSGYPIADEPSRKYVYDVADPRFAQVNAYYAIDSAQRFLRSLGFAGERTVPNGIRDFPTKAYAQWDSTDNSRFSPSTDTLYFGEGGVPDAEDADIVVHEYGHAIQYFQNPAWGCLSGTQCEMRAMGEGFSDYLALVVHASRGSPGYQDNHAACFGEWDSTAYTNQSPPLTYPPCLRRVDGSKVYPTDLVGNIYADGQIWSRALWDIQKAIGVNVATQIVLEHHYSLPKGATMPQAALEMVAADADLFGGFNEIPLRQAFCARGILSGADCVLPTNPTIIVPASKDTLVRQSNLTRNEGQSPWLRLKGGVGTATRLLLGFDLSGINLSDLKSAILEMTIAGSDQEWEDFGRTIDAHPLFADFAEGNGIQVGADPSLMTGGTGSGATWKCPSDQNISNNTTECASVWDGGSAPGTSFPLGAPTPPAVQTNVMVSGRLRWTVTADVKAGISRWVVKKTFEDKAGRVDFYSREGALAVDPYDAAGRRPRLIVTLN
jgi:hypothetical protein